MLKKISEIPHFYITLPRFYFLGWIIHILLLSIVAFFHFRLDHKLIVIENWVYDFSWLLALMSKSMAFIIYIKYFNEVKTKSFLDMFFQIKSFLPKFEVVFSALMCIGFFIYFCKVQFADNVLFSMDNFALHGVSLLIITLIDFLIIDTIESKEEITKFSFKKLVFTTLVVSFYFVSIFPFGDNLNISLVFVLAMMFSFYYLFGKVYIHGLTFTLFVIIPLFTLMGFDPVWGSKFSYFKPGIQSLSIYSFSLMGVFIGYFALIKRKRSSL